MNAWFQNAINSVTPGAWAVGVSGGADSVALLTLLRSRSDLSLHIVHLNHQTRGTESDDDARFVRSLADQFGLRCTIATRLEMESEVPDLPQNPSARYRRLRLALFRRVVRENKLDGVLLAHHADDQAETILLRLLRGSRFSGLAGMSASNVVSGVRCVRPLLGTRRRALRQWLRDCNQAWREDSSNQLPQYLRNRLRAMLGADPQLSDVLLELGAACGALKDWVNSTAPATNQVSVLADLPTILARGSARKWLIASGVSPAQLEPEMIDRLLAMCQDASTPSRAQFPSGVIVARRRGMVQRIEKGG
jgi:tRNA(Ile)-lysidine synthetase-like protein